MMWPELFCLKSNKKGPRRQWWNKGRCHGLRLTLDEELGLQRGQKNGQRGLDALCRFTLTK